MECWEWSWSIKRYQIELGNRDSGFFEMFSWEGQQTCNPEDRPNIPIIEEVLIKYGIERYFQHYITI